VDSLDICVGPKNARQVKTRYGEEHLKLTLKKLKGGLAKPRLERRGPSPQIPNNPVPIGAVVMGTAASPKDATFPTTGHKVVVKGPVVPKEKGMAKERDEEKEKEKVKAKEEEEEAGHKDLQQ
jgi:hypothetical protein